MNVVDELIQGKTFDDDPSRMEVACVLADSDLSELSDEELAELTEFAKRNLAATAVTRGVQTSANMDEEFAALAVLCENCGGEKYVRDCQRLEASS